VGQPDRRTHRALAASYLQAGLALPQVLKQEKMHVYYQLHVHLFLLYGCFFCVDNDKIV
jgi:hypothetical protein